MYNKSGRNAWEWCTFYHTVLPKWTNRLGVVTRKIVPIYYLQHFVGVLRGLWVPPGVNVKGVLGILVHTRIDSYCLQYRRALRARGSS